MTFLLVVIVILFMVFVVVGGIVIPLLGVIDQFRRHRPDPDPPPPWPPDEGSRNGITFLMSPPGPGVRLDR